MLAITIHAQVHRHTQTLGTYKYTAHKIAGTQGRDEQQQARQSGG